MEFMKYNLVSSLSSSLSTGNIIIDGIIAVTISSYMMNFNFESFKLKRLFKYCLKRKKAHINFNTKSSEISYNFKAIMHFIKNNKNDIKKLNIVNDIKLITTVNG